MPDHPHGMGEVHPQVRRHGARLSAGSLGLLLAASCVGCVRSRALPRPSGSGGPASDPPAPVAAVGDSRISKAQLSDFVHERFREQWVQAVDEMVDERILAVEAKRLNVQVPPAALDAAVAAEVKARAEQLRARFGEGADLAASVHAYYGLDLDAWKKDVLRPRLETHLSLQRVVRLSARTRDQVVARVLVTKDAAKAAATREKIMHGADFSLTALEVSEDPSRSLGGVIPPLARGDLGVPAVEEALFAAAPGALLGPFEVATPEGPEWHLYRVAERVPPWSGAPEALAQRLESDLVADPVTRAEYERWATRVRRAFRVTYFAPDGSVLRVPGSGR